MSCYCDGEVYYCENCRMTYSRAEVKERRVLDSVMHHGHDHADCLLCGAEMCDAGHVESCNVPDPDEPTVPTVPTPVCETCSEEIDVYGCGLECSHPDVVAARGN